MNSELIKLDPLVVIQRSGLDNHSTRVRGQWEDLAHRVYIDHHTYW